MPRSPPNIFQNTFFCYTFIPRSIWSLPGNFWPKNLRIVYTVPDIICKKKIFFVPNNLWRIEELYFFYLPLTYISSQIRFVKATSNYAIWSLSLRIHWYQYVFMLLVSDSYIVDDVSEFCHEFTRKCALKLKEKFRVSLSSSTHCFWLLHTYKRQMTTNVITPIKGVSKELHTKRKIKSFKSIIIHNSSFVCKYFVINPMPTSLVNNSRNRQTIMQELGMNNSRPGRWFACPFHNVTFLSI